MANCDIVGVGMSTLDVLLRVGDMPTWEAPGRLTDFRLDGGGPVATACVAAARLGARVGYVGTKGNDTAGELKTRFLADAGVDISRIVETGMPEDQVISATPTAEGAVRATRTSRAVQATASPTTATASSPGVRPKPGWRPE